MSIIMMERDRASVLALVEAERAANMAGDVDALMALRAPDFTAMPPGSAPIQGADDLREFLAGDAGQGKVTELRYETEGLHVDGDLAVVRVLGDGAMELPDGSAMKARLHSLYVARRGGDGRWQWIYCAWSVLPATASEGPVSDTTAAEADARDAADAWLRYIDEGDATASWVGASSTFRATVSENQWSESLESVQGSIGRPLRREFESARYTRELAGAPDGEYVVITYRTAFERKQHGTETVVPELDGSVWKVSGYFVK